LEEDEGEYGTSAATGMNSPAVKTLSPKVEVRQPRNFRGWGGRQSNQPPPSSITNIVTSLEHTNISSQQASSKSWFSSFFSLFFFLFSFFLSFLLLARVDFHLSFFIVIITRTRDVAVQKAGAGVVSSPERTNGSDLRISGLEQWHPRPREGEGEDKGETSREVAQPGSLHKSVHPPSYSFLYTPPPPSHPNSPPLTK